MSLNGVLIGAICTVVNHIDKCIFIDRVCCVWNGCICIKWFYFPNNEDNHLMKIDCFTEI